ncbi:MAG: hypothetical protein E7255_07855 [Lachnospiraceae bacterium]|nr:hypothetical protein [Lachnospiraceae bacterium]
MRKHKIYKISPAIYMGIVILSGCSNRNNNLTKPIDSPNKVISHEEATPIPITVTPAPVLNDLSPNKPEENDELTPIQEETSTEEVNEHLCSENEEVLFSFAIANSKKTASICISTNQQDAYIVYRFGTKDKIELVYPENTENSWDAFTYSYYMRGGGAGNEGLDLNYLEFENGGYVYKLYEEYSSESKETRVGILVTNRETGEETVIEGDSNSRTGSLIDLRDNDRINIIPQ